MKKAAIFAVTLTMLAAACTSGADKSGTDVAVAADSLLATDLAWARATSSNAPLDSILAYWTDDARVVHAGEPVVEGKAALREMVTSVRAVQGFQIGWTPERAFVSKSGDIGYTTGRNDLTMPDSTGKLTTVTGRYLTVWRKGPDGKWRCAEDYTSPAPPGDVTGD